MKNFEEFSSLINENVFRQKGQSEIVTKLLSKNSQLPKFFIGRNKESLELGKVVQFEGLVDDFMDSLVWEGHKIYKSKEIPCNAIVVNCSTSISPIEVQHMLQKRGVENIITYGEIISCAEWTGHVPQFVIEMRAQLQANTNEWYTLYTRLEDRLSRETLLNLILYRSTADLSHMSNYSVRYEEQYFEDFMDYSNEIFVDVGGYTGDTSEIFCQKYKDYRRVYFFEPSEKNLAQAKTRLAGFRDISFNQYGVSNKEEVLSFDASAGSCSAIRESGKEKIHTVVLDDFIKEAVTFVKMDIEGWELMALEGCSNLIRSFGPKLAIAGYHNTTDLVEIPKKILSWHPNYKVYLRHYTSGWAESVLYFKPT